MCTPVHYSGWQSRSTGQPRFIRSTTMSANRTLPLLALSQYPERSVSWLWRGRLAVGKLAMLDGDPGLGKTLLTLDLCARLTTGKAFPGDVPALGPVNVVLLNAEDAVKDTLKPRLKA